MYIKIVAKVLTLCFLYGIIDVSKGTNIPFDTKHKKEGAKMCKVAGYCRISRATQSIDRQIRNIKELYPDAVIFQEAYTGIKILGRKEWERLYNAAMAGKVEKIVFDSVSRMSRNAEDGFKLYQDLFNAGIELEFIKEPHINTAVYKENLDKQIATVATGDAATDELMEAITQGINRYMMRLAEQQIRIAFNQSSKEVLDLHQRTKEGIETARLNNKQIGGVKGRKLKVKKADPAKEQIKKHCKTFGGTLTDLECMKLIGIAKNTYYKYKKELLASI